MVRRVPRGAWIAVAAAALTLTACSTPRSSSVPSSQSAAPVSTSPYVNAPSAGGTPTTEPGTDLALGKPATVWWRPVSNKKALLQLRVTGIQRTTFKRSFRGWKITSGTAKTTPYFVSARVSASARSVSGRQVPLYVLDSKDQLVQASSFKEAFKPCGPSTFPIHTRPGKGTDVCLVYLVPSGAQLRGVTYRPDQSLAPITWKGAVTGPTSGSTHGPTNGKKSTKP